MLHSFVMLSILNLPIELGKIVQHVVNYVFVTLLFKIYNMTPPAVLDNIAFD